MSSSPLLQQLISAFCDLPGIGPRSAQRISQHLLAAPRESGLQLAELLSRVLQDVGHCQRCNTFCEHEICSLCADEQRDAQLLCVVETPKVVQALEEAGGYHGYYFVLMGHLSPLDGIGPEEIAIPALLQRVPTLQLNELIIATHPTMEGEATAHYIADHLHSYCSISRVARGLPLGSELDQLDSAVLHQALQQRQPVQL